MANGKAGEHKSERIWLEELSSFDGIVLSARQVTKREAEALMKRDPFLYAVDDERERRELV